MLLLSPAHLPFGLVFQYRQKHALPLNNRNPFFLASLFRQYNRKLLKSKHLCLRKYLLLDDSRKVRHPDNKKLILPQDPLEERLVDNNPHQILMPIPSLERPQPIKRIPRLLNSVLHFPSEYFLLDGLSDHILSAGSDRPPALLVVGGCTVVDGGPFAGFYVGVGSD